MHFLDLMMPMTVSINGSEDKLTIRNFNSESFIFEFAGGAVGTVNKDTWELELSRCAVYDRIRGLLSIGGNPGARNLQTGRRKYTVYPDLS